jgi:hypothetical protein
MKDKQLIEWICCRIGQLESQIGAPEVLDQKRVEVKLEAYNEVLRQIENGTPQN